MCRLFALRSDSPRPAFGPLWSAPNALAEQSREHADGWGVAHLHRGREMRVFREASPAHGSEAFRSHARVLSSELVLAHIRKASIGGNLLANTHPFEHAGWLFAHNGTVRGFDSRRAQLERRTDPALRKHLRGETDSERCFFLFLGELGRGRGTPLERAARALARVASYIRATDPSDLPRPSVANFMATDGDALVALRFGKMLHLAAPGHVGPLRDGTAVRALYISSEPTDAGMRWRALAHGQGVGIDSNLVVRRFHAG
jgi:predicted glutamine amidotransferase